MDQQIDLLRAKVPAPDLSDVPLLVRRKQRCGRNLFPEFFGQHPDLSGNQSGIFVAAVLAESLEGETAVQRVVIQRFRVVAVKKGTKPAAVIEWGSIGLGKVLIVSPLNVHCLRE